MKQNIIKQVPKALGVLLLATAIGVVSLQSNDVDASSHREAPLITSDPKADATDLYAFVSPDKTI